MLSDLDATRFYKSMTNGRTSPLLLAGENSNGDEVDVVAKFLSPMLPREGLIREALGSMLAVDLNIPTPEPYVIRTSQPFIDSVRRDHPDIAARLDACEGIGYASQFLSEGFQTWSPNGPLVGNAVQQAADILAFDCWFQNPDRRATNPNLLWNGSDFAVFDHELMFITEGILFWQPPWTEGAVDSLVKDHVFGSSLSKMSPDLGRIVNALKAITDARLEQYLASLPPTWVGSSNVAQTAVQFIGHVRDNADAAAQQVLRALQ